MKRFIVIVLDGFGMRAMADAATARPGDEIATTFGSILGDFPDLKLPTLEKLGLMNAYGKESARMGFSPDANAGQAELMHWGADTFMGHQEIMGTLPKVPVAQPNEGGCHQGTSGSPRSQGGSEGNRWIAVFAGG